jgi:hypothetical protein
MNTKIAVQIKPNLSTDTLLNLSNLVRRSGCGNISFNTLNYYFDVYYKVDFYLKTGCGKMQAYENTAEDVCISTSVVIYACRIIGKIIAEK